MRTDKNQTTSKTIEQELAALNQQIDALMTQASERALQFVEAEARAILVRHPHLDEFVMAMGGWFFTRKVGTKDHMGVIVTGPTDNTVYSHNAPKYIANSRLAQFIEEWDEAFHLTGEPMRFTATGDVVRDW